MKQILTILLLSSISILAKAQAEWCATDQMLEQWLKEHPEDRIRFNNPTPLDISAIKTKGGQNNKAANYIIPVVVHVIHFNDAGNISKAQIEDGIDILNTDFNRMNADTAAVRAIFRPYIADAQIEFRLAKKDPNGNCTDGINRVNSFLSYNSRDNVKSLSYWDATKYFNVWIVNSISTSSSSTGTVLGYAQFPRFGSDNTYGVVVRASEWGSIELASTKDGRTVTHEVGHCLDLYHTFQSGCGSSCVNSGDRVCDTPPQISSLNNSCDFSNNSCSNDAFGGGSSNPYTTNVPDQLENYMGYGLDCQGMFTEGQKDRMTAALIQVSKLISLTKSSNLVATGTNNGYIAQQCPPVADLYFAEKLACVGEPISFKDNSYRDTVANRTWTFTGGTPSSSTLANPSIVYNAPGIYDVKLRVENAAGASSIVVENKIIVHDTANSVSGKNYFEGFESANSFKDWTIISTTIAPEWKRTGSASKSGNFSAYFNNFAVDVGRNDINQIDELISPPIDVSITSKPKLKFEIAYKAKDALSSDLFKIGASIDCGASWINLGAVTSNSTLISSGTTTSNFVPNSSEWKSLTINLKPNMVESENLLLRFSLTSGNGNNIYIDNVQVVGDSATGLSDNNLVEQSFNIYPNPTKNGFYLELEDNINSSQATIYLTNLIGEKVKVISNDGLAKNKRVFVETDELSSGIYFVSYQNNGGRRITKKLIVN